MLHLRNNEEQVVALSGLLHDIGKLLNRCDSYMSGKALPYHNHQLLSVEFIKELSERGILAQNGLLKELVQRHHEDYRMEDMFKVQNTKDTYTKILAYIVSRANNYSSGIGNGGYNPQSNKGDVNWSYSKSRPLDSIFNEVSLDKDNIGKLYQRYRLKPLSYKNIFSEDFTYNDQQESEKLVDGLMADIKNLKDKGFNSFFVSLLHILEKYTWCIPVHTTKNICDISLFDHLKITSALALSSFLYHKETFTLKEKNVKDDSETKFLVICGKLEGLKDYIGNRDIAESSAKGLRGRGFTGQLMKECIIQKILKELRLTLANNVMNNGDTFYIIAHNTEGTKLKLGRLKKSIDSYFYYKFEGQLSLNLIWDKASGNDMKNFSSIIEKLNNLLKRNRCKSYDSLILSNPILDNSKAIKGVLPDDVTIGFLEGKKQLDSLAAKPYLVNNLQDTDVLEDYASGINFFDNYATAYESLEELGILTIAVDDLDLITIMGLTGEKEIEELSISSGDSSEGYEGMEFSKGYTSISRVSTLNRMINCFFYNYLPNRLNNSKGGGESIFSDYRNIQVDLANSYILNSNGEEIVIAAPWDELIFTAKFVNERFRKFVSFNPDITMSAGIELISGKQSVSFGFKASREKRKTARENGGNGLVIFDRFIPWKDFWKVFELGEFIYERLQDGIYNKSFLHRLLNYTGMAEAYVNSDYRDVYKLQYKSKFYYDLHRNLVPKIARRLSIVDYKDADSLKIILQQEEIKRLSEHFDNSVEKRVDREDFVYKYMRIVLNYAIRKNRGGEEGE